MSDPYAEYDPTAPPQTPPPAPSPGGYQPPPPGRLQAAGFTCPHCQYDLTGAVIGGTCPECGAHIKPQHLASAPSNGMAVTSMIMGILALTLCIAYGLPTLVFAPLGIIFGHIAFAQLRTGRYNPSARGFAKAGLICSYTALGLLLLGIGLGVLLFML